MSITNKFTDNKSLWEKFQDQKEEPWPFIDFDEFKGWYDKQEKMRKGYEIQIQKSHRDRD